MEFEIVGKFLEAIRKEFGEGNKKSKKVIELKELEQGNKMMEEYVQEFRRAARESGYVERLLVEKFKREMKRKIRQRLIEAKRQPKSIEQWYKRAV